MTRAQWSQRTSWDTVCARAAGRKKYNEARRRFAGQLMDEEVWPRLLTYGVERWGVCARIGREVGLSRWTIARYRKRLLGVMRGS